jgi:hypothetical protein
MLIVGAQWLQLLFPDIGRVQAKRLKVIPDSARQT